jgi:hypothetical protein
LIPFATQYIIRTFFGQNKKLKLNISDSACGFSTTVRFKVIRHAVKMTDGECHGGTQ